MGPVLPARGALPGVPPEPRGFQRRNEGTAKAALAARQGPAPWNEHRGCVPQRGWNRCGDGDGGRAGRGLRRAGPEAPGHRERWAEGGAASAGRPRAGPSGPSGPAALTRTPRPPIPTAAPPGTTNRARPAPPSPAAAYPPRPGPRGPAPRRAATHRPRSQPGALVPQEIRDGGRGPPGPAPAPAAADPGPASPRGRARTYALTYART